MLWDKRTPALIDAYKKVLNERGDGGKGWSMAWKMALWARLGDGNRANKIFKGYLDEQSCVQLFALCGKSMQVDGSLGMTAAITEMLMQSQDSVISLLPALPDEWPSGEFRGMRTRGGFELDLEWKDKRITRLKVSSKAGGTFRLRSDSAMYMTANQARQRLVPKDGIVEFPTAKGVDYVLQTK